MKDKPLLHKNNRQHNDQQDVSACRLEKHKLTVSTQKDDYERAPLRATLPYSGKGVASVLNQVCRTALRNIASAVHSS